MSGTYAVKNGKVVCISEDVPSLQRPVYFNKGDVPYFDKSAQRVFRDRTEKRQWLQQHKLREGGVINPDRRDD